MTFAPERLFSTKDVFQPGMSREAYRMGLSAQSDGDLKEAVRWHLGLHKFSRSLEFGFKARRRMAEG